MLLVAPKGVRLDSARLRPQPAEMAASGPGVFFSRAFFAGIAIEAEAFLVVVVMVMTGEIMVCARGREAVSNLQTA